MPTQTQQKRPYWLKCALYKCIGQLKKTVLYVVCTVLLYSKSLPYLWCTFKNMFFCRFSFNFKSESVLNTFSLVNYIHILPVFAYTWVVFTSISMFTFKVMTTFFKYLRLQRNSDKWRVIKPHSWSDKNPALFLKNCLFLLSFLCFHT